MDYLQLFAQAIWFFLPAYFANMSAAIFGGGKPVDFEKNFFDGKRIFGESVTFKGSLAGMLWGAFIGALQGNLLLGLSLGAGAIFGDAVFGAFIKRRFGLPRGAFAPLLDQLDFVCGAILAASLVVPIDLTTFFILVVFTPLAHFTVNATGYKLGLKKEPW